MDWYSVTVEAVALGASLGAFNRDEMPGLDDFADLLAPHQGAVCGGTHSWSATIAVDAVDPISAGALGRRVVDHARARAGLPDWPIVRLDVVRGDVVLEHEQRGRAR